MSNNTVIYAALSLLLFSTIANAEETINGAVKGVLDGLTIIVAPDDDPENHITVRLIGVEIPQIKIPNEPPGYAKTAVANYTTRILIDKKVRIEKDDTAADFPRNEEGHILAYVVLEDGSMYNETLLQKGYVVVSDVHRFNLLEQFIGHQKEAQSSLKGIWGIGKKKPPTDIYTYIKEKLLNKNFFLRVDAIRLTKKRGYPDYLLFWPGKIDVTNINTDGLYYRREGMVDRTPDGFLDQALTSHDYQWYTAQRVRRGEQILVFKVKFKRDLFIVYFQSTGKQISGIYFIFEKNIKELTIDEADSFIVQAFAESVEELDMEETRTVSVGMTEEEVKQFAGQPSAVLKPAHGVIVFVYEGFKVVFKNGVVDRIDY